MSSSEMLSVGAVILAAGEGKRMGGPKALQRLDGRSWLELAARRVAEAGLPWMTVVLGAEAERVRAETALDGLRGSPKFVDATISVVENYQWQRGRTWSIACGLADLPEWCGGALIHQVDFPLVRTETFRLLAECFGRTGEAEQKVILPVLDGRRGHPIVLGREIWVEVLGMEPDNPLSAVVHRDVQRVVEVPVEDEGICCNVNVAADLEGESDDQ